MSREKYLWTHYPMRGVSGSGGGRYETAETNLDSRPKWDFVDTCQLGEVTGSARALTKELVTYLIT